MISLEQLADGSISDRNFQALQRLVPDTTGLSVKLRAVCGWVDTTTPTVLGGIGYAVAKLAVGDVRITYTLPFPVVPVSIVGIGGSGGIYRAKLSAAEAPTTSTVRIIVHNDAGALIDSAFTFLSLYLA